MPVLDDLSVVSFESQFVTDDTTPDAAIRSSTTVYIETKTEPRAVSRTQLEGHLEALETERSDTKLLVVLTPDAAEPEAVSALSDERVVWLSFDDLVEALESFLARDDAGTIETGQPPTERDRFLVRELVRFLYGRDGLVGGVDDRVLVIPARRAWDEYGEYGLYVCQPDRSFRPSGYLAFYRDNHIEPTVPAITDSVERVTLTPDGVERAHEDEELTDEQRKTLFEAVDRMDSDGSERYGTDSKVLFLDENEGFSLERRVENDKTANDLDTWVAFVYGQRYVSADDLRESPEYTTDLES